MATTSVTSTSGTNATTAAADIAAMNKTNAQAIMTSLGAETTFEPPADLANDSTPIVPVVTQTIEVCQVLGWQIDFACRIYPSMTFKQSQDLHGGLALLKNSEADYYFPITEFPSVRQRALKRDVHGQTSPLYS